ncbi:TadE/TadG family type IV pilus assembly protein [Zhongshania marina]|uniref:Pilus assembly protein n=1 Tax=Zhongshania marina TaxID=2304603 RepID=A0ABX9W336_9GAMM|nr:pilus assembly protein [Zhongshania marina]
MAIYNFYRSHQQRQKGVVAIEFVFIFPVLFLICYATIVYALAFLVVQNMTYTGEEVLRKAIGFDSTICDEIDNIDDKATCLLCEEESGTDKALCAINATYNGYANKMLVFVDSSNTGQYSHVSSCTADLVCTLEIRGKPLTPVSIFGFTFIDLANNPDNKLISKASLLF